MKNKMKHILAMLLALCLFAETPLTAIPVLAEGTDEVTVRRHFPGISRRV